MIRFEVLHPQLEADPQGAKIGLKRFGTHKNQTSPEFTLNLGKKAQFAKKAYEERSGAVLDAKRLQEELNRKDQEIMKLKRIVEIRKESPKFANVTPLPRSFSPEPYNIKQNYKPVSEIISESSAKASIPSLKSENISDFSPRSYSEVPRESKHYNHPKDAYYGIVFQQPKYTKRSPKVVPNNPILGYTTASSSNSRENSVSPERRKGMAEYGNMMVGTSFHRESSNQFGYL